MGRQLQYPRSVCLGGLAKRRTNVRRIRVKVAELRVVEQVERFRSQFQLYAVVIDRRCLG